MNIHICDMEGVTTIFETQGQRGRFTTIVFRSAYVVNLIILWRLSHRFFNHFKFTKWSRGSETKWDQN